MSEEYSTYDGACSRAELLGQAPPSRSDWELANKDRKPSVSNDVTEVFLVDDVDLSQRVCWLVSHLICTPHLYSFCLFRRWT